MSIEVVSGITDAQVAAAIAAAQPAPLTTLDLIDDFLSGGSTTGIMGALGWSHSGTSGSGAIGGAAAHPGIWRLDTSASINTTSYLRLFVATGSPLFLSSEFFDLTWVFRANSTDTDTRIRLGLSNDPTTNAPVTGVYLEKVAADTQWFGVTRSASTETRSTAVATVDSSWHRIRMRRIDASTVGFTIDGGTEVTVATNVPTVGVYPFAHIWNNTAASKTVDIDFFRLTLSGLVR